MPVPVFVSRPNPATTRQKEFLARLDEQLPIIGLTAKTLGEKDYGIDFPLRTCRMLMTESNGLIVVALRRYRAEVLYRMRPQSADEPLERVYLTSSWCQIEPGMAFQLGMPMLILREKGVLDDGVLEKGVTGLYLPEIDIESDDSSYLDSSEWKELFNEFAARARDYRNRRGHPGNG